MRPAILRAAGACLGFAANADGVSRKAVSSPGMDPRPATEASRAPAAPGHEVYRYRHGSACKVDAGFTPLACKAACGEDAVCQSWLFVEAYGSSGARCELKQVPANLKRTCRPPPASRPAWTRPSGAKWPETSPD